MNQKSSQHTVYAYKNKFILKFGGSDIISSFLQVNREMYRPLKPEIYFADTEEWSLVETNTFTLGTRIDFGLWPAVLYSSAQEKVIVLKSEKSNTNSSKTRYDI